MLGMMLSVSLIIKINSGKKSQPREDYGKF